MSKLFVGTSGFSYNHWRGVFYPRDLLQKEWLRYYTKYFDTVEINATFYHQMKKETFKNWREIVGSDFVFSIKGSRFITHIKRLKDCQEPVERFFKAVEGLTNEEVLGERRKVTQKGRLQSSLDVILWQLSPGMKVNAKRLAEFLIILPQTWRHAFEFRHESWLDKKIFKVIRDFGAAVVFQDYPGWPITEEVTADFVYLRFHGRQALYSSCYTKKELKKWVKKIEDWMKKGLDVYAYFNNDALGYAVKNAKTLKKLCLKEKSPVIF